MFKWDENKKVELYNPSDRKMLIREATPKYIIQNPNGFRIEDIVHSLCIAVSEMIEMSEAEAEVSKIKTTLRNISKDEKQLEIEV